jgi:hypothetical protein
LANSSGYKWLGALGRRFRRRLGVRRQRGDLTQAGILGCGLGTAEVAEAVRTENQSLDRGAQVGVRQRGEHCFGAVERARSHPGRAPDHVGGPLVAVLAQPDGKDAAHRKRRCDDPGELAFAALRAERPERNVDLADGLGIEERVGDNGRRRVVVLPVDDGHDQHCRVLLALGQRRSDGDGGRLVTRFCRAHERSP